jgi:hypothetical protein
LKNPFQAPHHRLVMAVSAARVDWIAARQAQNHHFYQTLLDCSRDLRIGENIRSVLSKMSSRFVRFDSRVRRG